MKNIDLFLKMKKDLDGYQIGFHNIGLKKYQRLISGDYKYKDLFEITGADVSEKAIAERILNSGLKVVERCRGLRSTVMPVNDFNEESLNYTYNLYGVGTTYNIIVAIPYIFYYNGEKYFVGDINDWASFCNIFMFPSGITKEFIYGYYTKEIVDSIEERVGNNVWHELIYDDELEFVDNHNFYGKMSQEDQALFLREIFKGRRRLLSNLKLANSDKKWPLLFRTPYERMVIKNTREDAKRLIYEKYEKK